METHRPKLPFQFITHILGLLQLLEAVRFAFASSRTWVALATSEKNAALELAQRVYAIEVLERKDGALIGCAWAPLAEQTSFSLLRMACSFSSLLLQSLRSLRAKNVDEFGCHVFGTSASGKSTFIFNCMRRPHNWAVPCIHVSERVHDIFGSGACVHLFEWPVKILQNTHLLESVLDNSADAVVFVLDSGGYDQPEAVSDLIQSVLTAAKPGTPLLLVANKQDLAGSLRASEIVRDLYSKLALNLSQRAWRIQGCQTTSYIDSRDKRSNMVVAGSSGGVAAGVHWLVKALRSRASMTRS